MAAGRLDEDQLVDELLGDDDTDTSAHEGSPPKRPRSRRHHRQRGNDASAGVPRHGSPAAEERSHGAASQGAAGSGLAAEAAAVFSRLSASSSGSPVGARAAAEAAAAFAVGDGPARPPGTIHPGASLSPSSPTSAESAADLQRLHNRQWDWALAVHGSEDAALAAGFKPKDEPDYALYSVYMGRVRKCLESPDVEDPVTEAGAQLLRMVLAFRAYMACLYASGTFVMEHRYSNLETLSQLGELSAEVASLLGGRQQPAYRSKRSVAADSGAGSAGTCDSGTAHSNSAAIGGDNNRQPGSGGTPSTDGANAAGPASGEAAEAATQPTRSRRSESAPLVKRPSDLAAADETRESSGGGDGRRGRRSLDLKPLSDNSAARPGADRLKKAYRDRASMDVRPTIAAIKFSPKQRREVLQRRRELDAELERSQADRKTLLARLQTLTMRGGGAGQGGVMDASAALRGNLDAEGRVITDFSAWFTCRLLTPLQHARCNATCYPYMPDVIGISDVLAAEKQAC